MLSSPCFCSLPFLYVCLSLSLLSHLKFRLMLLPQPSESQDCWFEQPHPALSSAVLRKVAFPSSSIPDLEMVGSFQTDFSNNLYWLFFDGS